MEGKSISETRQWICQLTGPRGLMPPDWVTVRRWREKLEEADRLTEEGMLEMLELHYGQDFGAEVKLNLLPEVQQRSGLSEYLVRKRAGDALIRIGGRLYLSEDDYERIFGAEETGDGKERTDG